MYKKLEKSNTRTNLGDSKASNEMNRELLNEETQVNPKDAFKTSPYP